MKQSKISIVVWEDATSYQHTLLDEVLSDTPFLVRTFGVPIHQKNYVIVMTHDAMNDSDCDFVKIPKSLIREIIPLQ